MFLLEALGDNPFPRLFQLLQAAHIPWVTALHPSSKPATKHLRLLFITTSLSVILFYCIPLPLLRTPVITLGLLR